MFKELSKEKNSHVEKQILNYWEDIDVLNTSIENRKDNEDFVFYDGPATANNVPKVHHMLPKLLKDAFTKYKTMQGYHVLRKVGWDTHGLPVELEVEKELGFTNKADIEAFGIEKFNELCKQSVWRNKNEFTDLTKIMGQFIDTDNPYITYDNNYIETEWWILKKMFDEGYIYQGAKVMPYCYRCGTGLASHEVAQGYKEVPVTTVTVPFKLVDEEDTYFLVWTTTPWTLMANVALSVNKDEEYVKVLSRGNKFILAKQLLNKYFKEDYEVLETFMGKDLEHVKYEQLLPFVSVKDAFYVTLGDFVTMDDGTGIVHIAPAFGEDDGEVGKQYKLPIVNPVSEKGEYEVGPWQGKVVFDADPLIIDYLKENGQLFAKETITHNYPHCWRCGTPLIYYSRPSWYIEVTKIKDQLVEQNKLVNWQPNYVGEKRFANWLENANDWAISRTRYWGTPLPLWMSESGEVEAIGSIDELVERSIDKITKEEVDLHRPFVDNIKIRSKKTNEIMTRVPDVIDVWFDSGSMPFAQYHYPFENKELWNRQFPADFISEGVDQTRGWFYTLLVISVFVTGKTPFKNVLVNDMLLDKNGKKMSKSLGNGIDPFELIEEFGSDPVRWYLPYVSPVWQPIKFDRDGIHEVNSKFFRPLKNTYNFFTTYANIDGITTKDFKDKQLKLTEIDEWFLSKYHNLLKNVTKYYEDYDLSKVVRSITDFTSEDLSNWYIRRNRERFWASGKEEDKLAVYQTTYKVLVGLSQMIAPIASFTSEELYRNLTNETSVHLSDFPKYDESLINLELETKMSLTRLFISLGRNVREETKIKVRQPLSEVILDKKNEQVLGNLVNLIKEELNVKNIVFEKDLANYLDYSAKPVFKNAGKVFGKDLKIYQEELNNLNNEQLLKLVNNEELTIKVNNNEVKLTDEIVEITSVPKQGFNSAVEDSNFIILNTNLDEDLINEGITRELISKIQLLRKSNNYEIMDRINIYVSSSTIDEIIKDNEQLIKQETLAEKIVFKDLEVEPININDHLVKITLEQI